MPVEPQTPSAMKAVHSHTSGWMGVRRGYKARPLEWLIEKIILLVSLSAILMILLIFVFVMREAWPVFTGNVNSAAAV
jgi:ABC-type phosphate transport system permease subunit